MKMYEIWCEGYAITGNSATATHIGTARGSNFHDACKNYHYKHNDNFYDATHNTIWGCRLYPTESQARRSFG